MKQLVTRDAGDFIAKVAHSTRVDGDLSPSSVPIGELDERRRRAIDLPWRAVHQVHSDRVISVSSPPPIPAAPTERPIADALTTATPGVVLAVHSGDCVPIGFIHHAGAVAAAHAGWRGLEAGVLESVVRQLRSEPVARHAPITAVVGPHIRHQRYEFGTHDLQRLARRFGHHVIGETLAGAPALDLTAAIASELDRLEITVEAWSRDCTAADADQYWSHRARGESGRIALAAWLEESS